jgi:tRNA A-37 threonylcarbamoyl transferase component Bud32
MAGKDDRPKSNPSKPATPKGVASDDVSYSGLTQVDPKRLRTPEDGTVSRVDTLPEDFARLLGQKTAGIGAVIGNRFKLLEKLGGGAMGDVYVAENIAINVKVAVKLLKPDLLADAHFRSRFQREAQAIASIEHPNVARFFDLVVGDPTFLVMEYVRGQTLSARLREQKRFPVDEAVRIASKLCQALRAAHAVGVIHRDLKPSNVILSTSLDDTLLPKLIDFGLAKLAARTDEQSLTRTGQLVGTPQYMSPEQIAGKNVDPRSDIYALACLTYEMLSGQPPFTGADDFQILYHQVHEAPRPLRAVVPDAPAALEGVLACALSKDPAQRYASMGDFAAALRATLTDSVNPLSRAQAQKRASELFDNTGSHAAMESAPRRTPRDPAKTFAVLAVAVVTLGFGGGYIASRVGAKPAATVNNKAALFVLSEPPNALVEVDGKALPQTTPAAALDLPPGTHTLKIQRVGTAPVTQTVNLRAGERTAVQVTLPPVTHKVEVRSVPDGASVLLDGRLVLGETPTTIEVTDDDFHELRVEKTGYETQTRPLTPDDKQTSLTISLNQEKNPRGTVIVDGNSAAEVWIDDVNTGYTTPTLGIEVTAGPHTIDVRDGAGRRSQVAKVSVAQGATVRLLLAPGGAPTVIGPTAGNKP